MRKLTVAAFVSLDGVVQAPGGRDEDPEGGFDHGGWAASYFDDQVLEVMAKLIGRADALLLGRKTYDMFAASWPQAEPDDPIGAVLNRVPKHVVSRTLDTVSWQNSSLLTGDVAEAVAALKREGGGEIQVHGSGGLIQTLIANDLVDEFTLLVFPVVVGSGKRLFGSGAVPAGLKLVETTTSSTGVLVCTYVRAGELEYGELTP